MADAGSEGSTDAGKTKPNKPYGSPCERGECAPSLSCLPTTEDKFSAICSVWCIHDRDCPKKSRCGRLYVCLPD